QSVCEWNSNPVAERTGGGTDRSRYDFSDRRRADGKKFFGADSCSARVSFGEHPYGALVAASLSLSLQSEDFGFGRGGAGELARQTWRSVRRVCDVRTARRFRQRLGVLDRRPPTVAGGHAQRGRVPPGERGLLRNDRDCIATRTIVHVGGYGRSSVGRSDQR